jgi:hypothetical protein
MAVCRCANGIRGRRSRKERREATSEVLKAFSLFLAWRWKIISFPRLRQPNRQKSLAPLPLLSICQRRPALHIALSLLFSLAFAISQLF